MRVGIIGGGQLARMLALAGYPLGLRFVVLDPAPDACAGQVADLVLGSYDDHDRLAQLAERAELATFDFENVPVAAARFLEQQIPVFPPPQALATAQDRLSEKSLFGKLNIPTPPFAKVDTLEELQATARQIGLPAVLKTRRLGYDGKGQRILRQHSDIEPAWATLCGMPLILEGFVPFQQEVSILAVRDRTGVIAFYPLVDNQHRDGILRLSIAPCLNSDLEGQARDYAARVLGKLAYVGLLAIEFFVVDGQLLANEMAPRVHNSGHWTIDGAETSQFENHLRAILHLPLGSTAPLGFSAMLNLIGEIPDRNAFLAVPGAHFHDYGKRPRPGRKVGHVTLRADDADTLQASLARLLSLLGN
jgi:5-(carboxyamino)imidazole ribonucleotide synthase